MIKLLTKINKNEIVVKELFMFKYVKSEGMDILNIPSFSKIKISTETIIAVVI